jgi:hypothetical protein
MDRSELQAALVAFRPTLSENFQPPADWPATIAAYRTETGQPIFRFFLSDIPADWPMDERQRLAALRSTLHCVGSPDGCKIVAKIVDELIGPPVKLANEARDEWIYRQAMKGVAWKTIKARLADKPKWEPIQTIPGIRKAAKRYAGTHVDLPAPPARQRGRKAR